MADDIEAQLATSMRREAALAGVLNAVARSGDLDSLLTEIASWAAELTRSSLGLVFVGDGEVVATYMNGPDREPTRGDRPFGDDSALTKVLRDRVTLAFDDQSNIPQPGFAQSIEAARLFGIRSSAFAPMTSDGPPVGVAAFRLTVDPFTEEEIELLQTFAVQAGNAVTNARLLADIEQRNAELAEALELQTATAEVLRLIGEHPGQRDAVLQGILHKAAGLCDGEAGSITLVEGDAHRFVASYGPAMEPYLGTLMESTEGRRAEQFGSLDDRVFAVDDFASIVDGWTTYFSDMARTGNVRSYAFAPLTKGDHLVGRLHMFRHEVRPFSASELERLGSFAAQASLAIGNAQLFNDLDQALERQRAMTDVLEAVSTARFDIQPVFDRIANHAQRLCDDTMALVTVRDRTAMTIVAAAWPTTTDVPEGDIHWDTIDTSTTTGAVFSTGQAVHIRDWDQVPRDVYPNSQARNTGLRTLLTLPMRRHDEVIGAITFVRVVPGGYTDAEQSLLQAFTDQAAIAVDNARLLQEIEERNHDLAESLELQTATSDILELISSNPGELRAVLEGIVHRAASLCGADSGHVLLWRDGAWRMEAIGDGSERWIGVEVPFIEVNRRARDAHEPVFVDDFHVETVGTELEDVIARSDIRSFATVALVQDDEWIGNLCLTRTEIRPFDAKHGRILQAFADQASIAIANAKLFNDLDAALARQTAMTDVLDAVSTARLDIQPVFDRIVDHAGRLCDDTVAYVSVEVDGDVATVAAAGDGGAAERGGFIGAPMTKDREQSTTVTVHETGAPLHIRNWEDLPADAYGGSRAGASGMRTLLALPMRRHDEVAGVITFLKLAPGGYTDDEVSLLQAFTDQAAIAVDNARLLREIEQRNSDLAESLELQTATSEVLQLISANPGDLNIVLEGIITRAASFCEAETGLLWLRHGDELRCVAQREARFSFVGNATSVADAGANLRAGKSKQPVFVDDVALSATPGRPLAEQILATGVHSYATIPLLRDGEWIGNINVGRFEVRPFDEKQAAILQAFADQAAIAVENARLFNDLDQALARQTAMTDVLDAVSTARLDLQPVFDKVAEHADRLCRGTGAMVLVREGDELLLSAVAGPSPVPIERVGNGVVPIDDSSITGAAVLRGEIVHIRDWDSEDAAVYATSPARTMGHQSALAVPMMRGGAAIGTIGFTRAEPGGYTDDEIALLETFADQAAIAVDNARLLREIEQRNTELSESLELQTATSEILQLISDNPGNLDAVFQGIVTQAARLCDADMAGIMRREGDDLVLVRARGPRG